MTLSYETTTTDVLVVGAGGAGLRAAIEIAGQGVKVLCLSKERLGAAHTCMAEGGYNVALTEVNPLNNPGIHLKDTLEGGAYLNRGSLAYALTHEAPARLYDLESFGAVFDRAQDGKIAQRFSGKQTYPHTVFVGDYTGQAIMSALVDQARRLHIPVWDEHFTIALFNNTDGHEICGALVIDMHSGKLTVISARSVILCTGGGGRMYSVTTNAAANTADGFAMALRLGVQLVDMEQVQFHPTGMILPASMRGKLVTESVRGEGGRLFNRDGERFMERYNPQRLELAGRDEVARSIFKEVQAGRGTDAGGVYLSVAHLAPTVIEERLPNMLEQFLKVGVDIRKEPMQIHPSMHHMMGGIQIDDQGACNLAGLFAAGEVAGGEHGGNRLGGNALAGCQVMGRRAAISAAKYAARRATPSEIPQAAVDRELARIEHYLSEPASLTEIAGISQGAAQFLQTNEMHPLMPPHAGLAMLQKTMWEKVGIMRREADLQSAAADLVTARKYLKQVVRSEQSELAYNRSLIECLELENMIDTAEMIVFAALLRTESRGAHYRHDYDTPREEWAQRNIALHRVEGKIEHAIVNQSTL
jgi:fumarate reductase (CoM/CoB) subunit A